MGQDRLDEAEAAFRRNGDALPIALWRRALPRRHRGDVEPRGGVYLARHDYATAEAIMPERHHRHLFAWAQSPDHLNTGVARIKLGRALLRQGRIANAEGELKEGYDIVSKQAAPGVSWLSHCPRGSRRRVERTSPAGRRGDHPRRSRPRVALYRNHTMIVSALALIAGGRNRCDTVA